MPVPRETEVPFLEHSKQVGVKTGQGLDQGAIFKGFQKSKGNSYEVEVVLQVNTVFADLVHAFHSQPHRVWASERITKTFCEVNGKFQLSSPNPLAF
jgi:hypothetical protein